MKNKSCLPGRKNSMCQICGTNIDTEHVAFTGKEANLVYMDKVFSYNEGVACPILLNLCTEGGSFKTELEMKPYHDHSNCGCGSECGCGCSDHGSCGNNSGSCGCSGHGNCGCSSHGNCGSFPNCQVICCCNSCGCGDGGSCTLDSNAVFNVTRSYVLVKGFTLSPPGSLTANQVSVDGVAVDSLTYGNGYTAAINNIIPEISNSVCMEAGLPTKSFFLISGAGPWAFRATFVLEGTVNTGGKTCCFKAKISTEDNCPIIATVCSNIAVSDVSIPCTINGIAPVINFNFSGNINLLNPELAVTCVNGSPSVILSTRLAIEPTVNLEVVRRTLFCVDACEGLLPCDGTEEAFEALEEECECPPAPPCKCGTAVSPEKRPQNCGVQTCCQWSGYNGCSW